MTPFLIVILALGINAIFVAAEFATVSVRKARVEALAEQGNASARLLLPNIRTAMGLYRYVAACQIGITASSLFLGAFGQDTLTAMLGAHLVTLGLPPGSAGPLATSAILLLLTLLQVVMAELVPKSVAMRYPERVALSLSYVLTVSMRAFSWFISFLNFCGRLILARFHVPLNWERHVHSPEELELLIIRGREQGSLEEEEHRRLRRVLRFGERRVREVMVPRTRMRTISRDSTAEQLLEAVASSPFTRLPVFDGSPDAIVGIVHVKDVAIALSAGMENVSVEKLMRSVLHVPLAQPIDEVLETMRRERAQMAIVLDEYGGTAGLVTMEDLVEEILGDVQDEFDREAPAITRTEAGRLLVRGDFSLADLEEETATDLEEEEVHTVGGLVMKLLGRPPHVGDEAEHGLLHFQVDEVRGRRIQRVTVTQRPPPAPPEEA